MSLEILGESFDLHGGGDDLVFPHHENERGAGRGRGPPVRAPLGPQRHGGGRRREDVEVARQLHDARGCARRARCPRVPPRRAAGPLPLADRAGPTEMRAAGEAVERLDALVRRADGAGIDVAAAGLDEDTVTAFRTAMDNDFGTPAAVATIFDAVKRANVAIDARRSLRRPPRSSPPCAHLRLRSGSKSGSRPTRATTRPPRSTRWSRRGSPPARRKRLCRGRPHPRRARGARDHPRGHRRRHASGIDEREKRPGPEASPGSGRRPGRGSQRGRASCCAPGTRRVSRALDRPGRDAPVIDEITELAAAAGARVRQVDGRAARRPRPRTEAPQGVLALAAPIRNHDIDDLLGRARRVPPRARRRHRSPATSAPCSGSPRPRASPASCCHATAAPGSRPPR